MPKLFVSYSHSDKEAAKRVEAFFRKLDFDIIRDESILSPGDQLGEVLIDELINSDGCILLLSQAALDSGWVRHEIDNALVQLMSAKKNYQIYPLIVEEGMSPHQFPRLASFMWGSIVLPSQDEEQFTMIANKCLKHLGVDKKLSPSKKIAASAILNKHPDYDRFMRIVRTAFLKEIEDLKKRTDMINESILSQHHILTPNMIADKESKVFHGIWVITKHLENDTEDVEICRSVTNNLVRGIEYKYFVVPSEIINVRMKKYFEIHFSKEGCDASLVKFYELPNDFVMTSAEIVIYDAIDIQNTWGYYQVIYGRTRDVNTRNYFYEISDNDMRSIVTSVDHGIHNNRYKTLEIKNVTTKPANS